jgi:hypothetical protein
MSIDSHDAVGGIQIAVGILAVLNGIREVRRALAIGTLGDQPESGALRFLWNFALRTVGLPAGLWLIYRGTRAILN